MSNNTLVNFAGSGLNNSSSSGLTLAQLDTRYLNVNGGDKMLVSLDDGNDNIINVLDPVNPEDAARKNYVDSSVNTLILLPFFPVLTSNSGLWVASAS